MQLRDYQQQLIDETREALRKNQRVLMQAPTGAGKTAITVHMMSRAAAGGKRSCFVVHQNELLHQTSKALWKQKLEHGMIAAGRARSGMPTQVASVQTLVGRTSQYEPWDLIIIDEAHRSAAATYKAVIAAYPKAKVIGLTATPQRTDGKGLGDMYQAMVEGPTIRDLIDAGYLCDYEIYAPPVNLDISGVKTTGGDWNKGGLEVAVNKPSITGDAVAHYLALTPGKRCVVMCVTIKHAQDVATQYNAMGVPAACLDGTMSNAERDKLLTAFKDGKLLVLTAVNLLIEGVDVPSIEVVQWLRPTQSLIIWMQGNGRGFRMAEGKDVLIILDHVGNYARHGLPDDMRHWSLEGKKKGKRKASDESDIGIQTCDKCRHVFRSGVSACPKCGSPVELKERKIEQVDGELQKVERQIQIRERKQEQGTARTLEELVRVGVRRKLNNPAAWAANVSAAREGRKPTKDDFNEAKRILAAIRSEGKS